MLEGRDDFLLPCGFRSDDGDILVHCRRVGIVGLVHRRYNTPQAVVVLINCVVAMVIPMVSRRARSRSLEEIIGLGEVYS